MKRTPSEVWPVMPPSGAFVSGSRATDEVLLQSRDEKPMNRYFPELVAPLAAALPARASSTVRTGGLIAPSPGR